MLHLACRQVNGAPVCLAGQARRPVAGSRLRGSVQCLIQCLVWWVTLSRLCCQVTDFQYYLQDPHGGNSLFQGYSKVDRQNMQIYSSTGLGTGVT